MTSTAPAPIASFVGFECPLCGHWTKTEQGSRSHMRACAFRDNGPINGHQRSIRYSRRNGSTYLSLHCSCAAGVEGVTMFAVAPDAKGREYVNAVFSLHRSTGASLLDVVNGDA